MGEVNMEKKNDFSKEDAYQTLGLVNSWINNVDSKASFALAFVSVILGFCISNGKNNAIVRWINAKEKTFMVGLEAVLVLAFIICCIVTVIVLLSVLIGSTKNKDHKKSLVFFGSVSKLDVSEYERKALHMDENTIKKELVEQIHTNSQICSNKFRRYNIGMLFLITSFILGVAVFLLG